MRGEAFGELRGDFRDDAFARVKWQHQDEADFGLLGVDACPYKREGRARNPRPDSCSLAEKGRKRRSLPEDTRRWLQGLSPCGWSGHVQEGWGLSWLVSFFCVVLLVFFFLLFGVCVYVMYIYNIYTHILCIVS